MLEVFLERADAVWKSAEKSTQQDGERDLYTLPGATVALGCLNKVMLTLRRRNQSPTTDVRYQREM